MKTTSKTTKMITMGLFALCTIGLSNATFAAPATEHPVELKLIGKVKSSPVFQLNLNNDKSGEYIIKITDANHNGLYSEKVKGIDISRKYQLQVDEADLNSHDFGVRVEVTSVLTHKTEVYKISTETNVTSNIVVAQL